MDTSKMGIKNLNAYLTEKCSKTAIHKIHLTKLQDKTVAVDISIYMYKFKGEDNYMEQLYLFLSLFKYYCITPIFIFDGKAPPEKWRILKERYALRKEAEHKYDQIVASAEDDLSEDVTAELETLRKQMVRLDKDTVKNTKELMDAFGFAYYDAPSEADHLCAYFVNTGIAYACMSDDCDMFLLGCPRVLRCLSMLKHSAIIYHTDHILSDLNLTHAEFLEIAVLSGTDYSKSAESMGIAGIANLYHHAYKSGTDRSIPFYEWMQQHRFISSETPFQKSCSMFQIQECFDEFRMKQAEFAGNTNIDEIKRIMTNHLFIFV
jgi:5'-3' exonuclease